MTGQYTIDPLDAVDGGDPIAAMIQRATGSPGATLVGQSLPSTPLQPTVAPTPQMPPVPQAPQARIPEIGSRGHEEFVSRAHKAIPAVADDHVKSVLNSYEAGVLTPKLGKIVDDLRQAIHSKNPEDLPKALDKTVEAFGSPKFSKEPGKALFDFAILKGGLSRAANEAAMGLLKGILDREGQQKMTVGALQPSVREQMTFLPHQVDMGELQPGMKFNPEQYQAMSSGKTVPGLDTLNPDAILSPFQEMEAKQIATTGVGSKLGKQAKEAEIAWHTAQAKHQGVGPTVPEGVQKFNSLMEAQLDAWAEQNPGKSLKDLSKKDLLGMTEKAWAARESQPILGTPGGDKAQAEADIAKAKATGINSQLNAEFNKTQAETAKTLEEVKKLSGENLYDASTFSDRLNLLRAQSDNIKSEIEARKTGAQHWKDLSELYDARAKNAESMTNLAVAKKDIELYKASQQANEGLFRQLITFANEDKGLMSDPKFIDLFNQVGKTQGYQLKKNPSMFGPDFTVESAPIQPSNVPIPSHGKVAGVEAIQKLLKPETLKELEKRKQ